MECREVVDDGFVFRFGLVLFFVVMAGSGPVVGTIAEGKSKGG